MPDTLSLEEVKRRIYDRHGDSIKMSNYITCAQDFADFECQICGRKWSTFPYWVYGKDGGSGCAKCNRAVKYSIEEVREIVINRNAKLISKRYKNNGTKMKIKFPCGHIRNMNLRDFMSGKRCPCLYKKEKTEKTKRETLSFVLEIFTSLKFQLVSLENLEGGKKNVSVGYICQKNHFVPKQKLSSIMVKMSCKECSAERVIAFHTGSGMYEWKNRNKMISDIRSSHLREWYRKSWENCDYKCIITGKPMEVVHHLYPFNEILGESLEELGMRRNEELEKLSLENRKILISKISEIHARYPLGVCLTEDMHRLFHKTYGLRNFTPENFYEFYSAMKKEVN